MLALAISTLTASPCGSMMATWLDDLKTSAVTLRPWTSILVGEGVLGKQTTGVAPGQVASSGGGVPYRGAIVAGKLMRSLSSVGARIPSPVAHRNAHLFTCWDIAELQRVKISIVA
jgi:hypothetical protein